MAWIVLAATDLNDYSAGAKVNALRTAALAAGQTDPFPRVMSDVVARLRAQVGSCKTNQLSATPDSIPPDIKTHACWLIIEALQGRLMGLRLTDEEKGLIKKADDYMAKVATCDFLVMTPIDPEPSPFEQGGAITVVSDTTRVATRARMDGL